MLACYSQTQTSAFFKHCNTWYLLYKLHFSSINVLKQPLFWKTGAHRCWSAGWGRASPVAGVPRPGQQGPRSGVPSPRPWPSTQWTAPAAGRSPARMRTGSAGSPDTSASLCYLRPDTNHSRTGLTVPNCKELQSAWFKSQYKNESLTQTFQIKETQMVYWRKSPCSNC